MKTSTKFIITFLVIILLPMAFLAFLSNSLINKRIERSVQEAINDKLKAAWLQYDERSGQMKMGMLQAANSYGFVDAVKKKNTDCLSHQWTY
ncbi:MAG: hypothetical protein HZC10_03935 [Nitrospirae bacterium]|nr:hypothetical protein [Nitrospirota bacterium]